MINGFRPIFIIHKIHKINNKFNLLLQFKPIESELSTMTLYYISKNNNESNYIPIIKIKNFYYIKLENYDNLNHSINIIECKKF